MPLSFSKKLPPSETLYLLTTVDPFPNQIASIMIGAAFKIGALLKSI
jgi:hypothetical protein